MPGFDICFYVTRQIGCRKFGTAKRPRYSPRKPCYVVLTHSHELESESLRPPLFKIAAQTIYQDETLRLARTVSLNDVEQAKKWWVPMLNQFHKLTGFWNDIEHLGPAKVVSQVELKRKKPKLVPTVVSARRYPLRNKVAKISDSQIDLTVQTKMSLQIQRQLIEATNAATKETNAATATIAAVNAAAERVKSAVKALNESHQQRTPT